jgi:hypothetical protein
MNSLDREMVELPWEGGVFVVCVQSPNYAVHVIIDCD